MPRKTPCAEAICFKSFAVMARNYNKTALSQRNPTDVSLLCFPAGVFLLFFYSLFMAVLSMLA